jgi:DNA-binding NtrC family response regulator
MAEKEVILTTVTDRNQLKLLEKQLSKEGYKVVSAPTVQQLMTSIKKEGKISMAVVDIDSFDEEAKKQLEELNNSKIPFFVISPQRSPSVQDEILKKGASGLFSKGLHIKELIEYIHGLLNKKIL